MATYEASYKEQAVKMASAYGAPRTAEDLGVPINTLYTWISRAKTHGDRAHVGSGNKRNATIDTEKVQMAKRIKELEKANEILKDALGFFASSQKK
jgi:transposase